ncbi:MAG: tRNA 2-thiocytidine biosynthesis TtcA family protein [Helicobacteraceae bacterium]
MLKFSRHLTKTFAQTVIEYGLIKAGDRILVGFSGGKDSTALLHLLKRMKAYAPHDFDFFALTVSYGMGEDLSAQAASLKAHGIAHEILQTNIFERAKTEIRQNSSFCSYFSRQRRGELYLYAKKHGFNKLALGHHLDDAAESFFMNMFQNGKLRSMPPIYTTDDGKLEVIRPLIRVREQALAHFARFNNLAVVGDEACPAFKMDVKMPYLRARTKEFLRELSREKPDLFSMLSAAFCNLDAASFSDKKYL